MTIYKMTIKSFTKFVDADNPRAAMVKFQKEIQENQALFEYSEISQEDLMAKFAETETQPQEEQ